MTSVLTLGRTAAWAAIDSWPALKDSAGKSLFVRQDRFERGGLPSRSQIESGYGPGDLPAIAIVSRSVTMQPVLTRTHEWRFEIVISIWTPDWDLLPAERYAPEVVNALYAATPAGTTVSFIKNPATGTGFDPSGIPGVTFNFVQVGGDNKTEAVRTDITCQLRIHFSPYEQ